KGVEHVVENRPQLRGHVLEV
ncbi:hypothetical protein A2U01_0066753, partial [Trifolium medium]|nr:hypothetical protein [Trifolium medium]